jgi:hypothetical protein
MTADHISSIKFKEKLINIDDTCSKIGIKETS